MVISSVGECNIVIWSTELVNWPMYVISSVDNTKLYVDEQTWWPEAFVNVVKSSFISRKPWFHNGNYWNVPQTYETLWFLVQKFHRVWIPQFISESESKNIHNPGDVNTILEVYSMFPFSSFAKKWLFYFYFYDLPSSTNQIHN